MRMLRSGINIAVIALSMGHDEPDHDDLPKADLELKQRALDRTVPVDGQPGRYRRPTTSSTSSTTLIIRARIAETACTGPGPKTVGIIASPE